MADVLATAVLQGNISEDDLARHAKWCNSERVYRSGVEPARMVALAFYGFIPERLREGENKPVPNADALLAEYRRRIERT